MARPERRTRNLHFRFTRYVQGAFAKGAPYMLASRLLKSFAATTQFSEKHIRERVFPRWRSSSAGEWNFEKIRHGRSFETKITRGYGVQAAEQTGAEIRARLQGAITAYLRKTRSCRVDLQFCARFAVHAKVPEHAVVAVWRTLRKFGDFSCQWDRRHLEHKFVVSHPQTSPGCSSPYGGEEIENSGGTPPSPGDRPRAAPANVGGAPAPLSDPLGNGCDRTPDAREPSGLAPLHICGRWISRRKLFKFATWLAVSRLRAHHAGRAHVQFTVPHARNFAFRALCAGYRAEALEAAYVRGVQRSEDDAIDVGARTRGRLRDRGADNDTELGYAVRAPSQAVSVAWLILRGEDPREDVDRWAEFFAATERRPRLSALAIARRAESARPARARRASEAEVAALREKVASIGARAKQAAAAEGGVTMTELAQFLRECGGVTVAQFRAAPAPWRRYTLAKCRDWIAAKRAKNKQAFPGDRLRDGEE